MTLNYNCTDPWLCLDKHGREIEYFWISGVFLLCTGIFGMIGNICNLWILCQKQLRQQIFYQLLASLAGFDVIFIISYGIDISYQSLIDLSNGNLNVNVGNFTYYFINIGLTGSVYSTVAVSIERCFRVYRPTDHHTAFFYFLPITALVAVYNIPIWLERNYHFQNGTTVATKYDWASSKVYQEYQMFASLIIISVIPITMVFVFNGMILYKILIAQKKIINLSKQTSAHRKDTINVLFLVVSIFVICHGLRIAYISLLDFGSSNDDFEDKWYFIVPIYKLAITFNSSVNFIIYCQLSGEFKIIFNKVLGSKMAIKKTISHIQNDACSGRLHGFNILNRQVKQIEKDDFMIT